MNDPIFDENDAAFYVELPGNVPSKKNSKRRIRRGTNTYMVPSEAHEAWHAAMCPRLIRLWNGRQPLEAVKSVSLTFYPADKRRKDLSNAAESVMDILVDTGILKDDNWFVVPILLLSAGSVEKENPRVMIIISV